jgi:paraquat-inducible protein B
VSPSERERASPARTQAAIRRSRWPGWIWAIPIAALLVVGWWMLRELTARGENVTITFDDVHGLKPGGNTSVLYRGMKIGTVSDVTLAKDGGHVDVTANIDDDARPLLRSGTRFWLRGASPSLGDLSALSSVISGPTLVMETGPGEEAKHFTGLAQPPVAPDPRERPQLYGVSLPGSVGGLTPGKAVKLRGFPVGEVKDVGFHYDAKTGALATPVTLALYPSLFHLESGDAPALTAAIDRLIQGGLRAKLERDPPLVGEPQVTLDLMPDAPAAAPPPIARVPRIPAAPEGGTDGIISRIDRLPLDQIAQNILDTSRHINAVVASPQIGDAIAELDATLKQIDRTSRSAGPKITTLVSSLQKTAAELDHAAQAADTVLGGQPSQNGMEDTMREVTEAARSLRELADYLDRHPEALIEGRSGQ